MPIIDYSAPIQVLAAVRGHPFDRNAFATLFDGMAGISVTFVDQPAAARLMQASLRDTFHVLLLYDMPGVDFTAAEMGSATYPEPEFLRNFTALLERGMGVVALHHALAGWPNLPEYAELLGGRFLYRPAELRGLPRSDSGYRHDVTYETQVVAHDHPITAGIPARFAMTDELYLAEIFEDSVTPLLRANHAFTAANFYSATAVMEGRMHCNTGWQHPDGSNVIGWVKRAHRSPLAYLQPGDNNTSYSNPIYQRLVENAIRWAASEEALAWAAR